jgi:transposase-like protein
MAKRNAKAQSADWFSRIAQIATDLGDTEYSADDVRTILKAWRKEYTERKRRQKAAAKATAPEAETEAEVEEEEEE